MRLHEETDGGVNVIRLEGEIDLHFAPVLREVLQAKANRRCPALLLDMTAVEFINSSGIAAVLEYLRDATINRSLFCIGGVSSAVGTVLEIVRLDRAMPIFHDAAKARQALITRELPAVSQPLFAEES